MKSPAAFVWCARGVGMAVLAAAFAQLGAAGCSSTPRPALTVDCSVQNQYVFSLDDPKNPLGEKYTSQTPSWFGYGDSTPGAVPADAAPVSDAADAAPPSSIPPVSMPIENGGICGAQYALFLQSSGHNDYGSGFGDYAFAGFNAGGACGADGGPVTAAHYVDASAYEGLSFWARNPGETTKGVILELTDIHSAQVTCPTAGQCVPYSNDAGSNMYVTMGGNGTLPQGSSVASPQPPADACGNNFTYPLLTTGEWQLYTIPFSSFHQGFQPDRARGGLDTAHLALMTIVVPKEAVIDLWVANLGFYRTRSPEAGP
jgi:hypothetical protein